MDKIVTVVHLTPAEFAAVIALFLPGFVSLKIHGFLQPAEKTEAAELLIDAFGFSLLNAGVFSWAIFGAGHELAKSSPNYAFVAGEAALICVVGPLLWPLLFRAVQSFGLLGGLQVRLPSAFDTFFSTDEPCWILVHLADGSRVGGRFGGNSYAIPFAPMNPNSGDFYIEELWLITEDGKFDAPIADSKGALFRQKDYVWLELFWDNELADEAADAESN